MYVFILFTHILDFSQKAVIKNEADLFLGIPFTFLYIYLNIYLPTPPLEQDMTQGQFLSGV